MSVRPSSVEEISAALRAASASRTPLQPFDLRGLSRMVEYTPEDMTATVEGGMTLGLLQQTLNASGQWLPIDPPNPDRTTLADLLAFDRSGPRRYGFGTIRDYLIGIKVVLASGEVIKAGGKVVKNVAGYDLCKLFIGSKHSLGIIVEATFKLKPLPEQELILQKRFDSVEELSRAALTMRDSTVDPVVFDVHNLGGTIHMVVGFSGAREDVAEHCSFAERAGFGEGTLAYDQDFHQSGSRPEKVSVLPSKMVEVLRRVAPATATFLLNSLEGQRESAPRLRES